MASTINYHENSARFIDLLRQYYADGGTVDSLRQLFRAAIKDKQKYFTGGPFDGSYVNNIMKAVVDLSYLCTDKEEKPETQLPIQTIPNWEYYEDIKIGIDTKWKSYTEYVFDNYKVAIRPGKYNFYASTPECVLWIRKQKKILALRGLQCKRLQCWTDRIQTLTPPLGYIIPVFSDIYNVYSSCISIPDSYAGESLGVVGDKLLLPSALQVLPGRSIIYVPNWKEYVTRFFDRIIDSAILADSIPYYGAFDLEHRIMLLEGLTYEIHGCIFEIARKADTHDQLVVLLHN